MSSDHVFHDSLTRQVTESAVQSFAHFSQRFVRTCDQIHERNMQFLSDMSDSCDPSLSDRVSEWTDLLQLLTTCGNMQLNRLLLLLSQSCREMDDLTDTGMTHFLPSVSLYAGTRTPHPSDHQPHDYEDLTDMSSVLSVLFDLMCYVRRCCDVGANVMQQLMSLVCRQDHQSVDVTGIRLDFLLDRMAKLAVALIGLDVALTANNVLKADLISYKRMIELAVHDSHQFGIQDKDRQVLKVLKQVCLMIEKDVMQSYDDPKSGHKSFFSQFVDSILSTSRSADATPVLCDQMSSFIKNSIAEYESAGTACRSEDFLSIVSMFIIYVWFFKKEDKRLLKQLTDCQKKTNSLICHLPCNVSLFPDHFLASKVPKGLTDKRTMDAFDSARESLLTQSLEKDFKSMREKVVQWLVSFETNFAAKDLSVSIVSRLTSQMRSLDQGMDFSQWICSQIRTTIFLHLQYKRPVSKKEILLICRLVSLLKSMDLTIRRNKWSILLFQSNFAQYQSYVGLKHLNGLKKRLVSEVRRYSEKKLDLISAVILVSNCMHGVILSPERQVLTLVSLSLITHCMNDSEMMHILSSVNHITRSSHSLDRMTRNTDCSFLFATRSSVLPVFLSQVQDVRQLRYFLSAFSDCELLMRRAYHYEDEERLESRVSKFKEEVLSVLKTEYLDPLSRDFETELRLQTHMQLKLEDQSPFVRKTRDFWTPLSCPSIRVFDRLISIRDHVSLHLNTMSYNLTTIAMHDWTTYESMLNLARKQFGLSFVLTQLPTQTLEQGIDVLDVTRNLKSFVSNYAYNLNNQMFVQKRSQNKHLNVLLIRHVGNCITTHGVGIMSTAVNLTYQFLKQKLEQLSQLLFHEHIRSRLMRDSRSFRESGSHCYSYQKADKFVKGIRKLGLSPEGHSLLDQMRILVTEMGNGLALVRIMRSGALHASSTSANFVPDLEDLTDTSFSQLCRSEGLTDSVMTSAENLDSVLSSLSRNFSEATDYLQLLVRVFGPTLRQSSHLKHVHMMLPPLTLAFVEHAIACKEHMNRNNASSGFTDDGFAVGVAYLIRVLDQESEWQSLHWFLSVQQMTRSSTDQTGIEDRVTSSTKALTLKRLSLLQREFHLLNYNLTACKILFHS